jgi:hypothetical protein
MNTKYNPARQLYLKFENELNNRRPVETENAGFFKKPINKDNDSIEHLYNMFASLREGREEIKNARTNL